jgi:hypothetical protein
MKETEVYYTYRKHKGNDKFVQEFGWETSREDVIWETKV